MVQSTFETKIINYQQAEDLLELGYCITVHKSQGTGWDSVILYQPPQDIYYNPAKLYYTAVTRAANQFYLITEMHEQAFWKNASQQEPEQISTLQKRIRERS